MQNNGMSNNGGNSNNMMDMLKTQMMTMTMLGSMNGKSNAGGSEGIYAMLYVFIVTGVIDFLCKTVGPQALIYIKQYYGEKMKSSQMLKDLVKPNDKSAKKTSSITIQVNVADHQNMLGQALLDYITNNKNTKHVSYKKQNFILNEMEIIEISEEFLIKLTENKIAETGESVAIEQTLELFSYTKSMKELRSFLDKITHEYKIKIENKLGDKMYYFNQHPMNAPTINNGKEKDYSKLPPNSVFTMKPFQTNRKFSNLFGPEIEVVRKRVDFFLKNKKWYDAKGIPYTLGLLLSGQAGAGKTSSIKCLANETKRHIININLNNDITKTQLENLFFNEMIVVINVSTSQTEKYYIPLDQRIYVLEDIDCQSDLVMERSLKNSVDDISIEIPVTIKTNPHKPEMYENKNKNPIDFTQAEKIDLSFLLNLLDGVLEIPGRIVIMTSNYPKMLDHALVRPGRIDVIADFKKCSHQTIIQMMEFFYDIVLTPVEKDIIMDTKEASISPAEMGKLMFENFGDYKNTLHTLSREYIEQEKRVTCTENNYIHLEPIHIEKRTVQEKMDKLDKDFETSSAHNDVTLIEDVPIPNEMSRTRSYYNREYEICEEKMRCARTEEEKGRANIKLLEFQAKLKYDETDPFKPEEEKGYAREMQKRLELLKIKIKSWDDDLPHPLKPEEEKGCAVEKKKHIQSLKKMENNSTNVDPYMKGDHLDKFEKIYHKVVDAKTEKEKGCADVELINFRTNLQLEASYGQSEQAKSSAQEVLKRVELLKTLMDEKLAETGYNGAFSPSNPKKTLEQYREENEDKLDIKKTYGWDTYGDRAGLDTLDGFSTTSQYAELNELYG